MPRTHRRLVLAAPAVLLAVATAAALPASRFPLPPVASPDSLPPSAAWLALLPDGPEKRRFVLDCTGCHQFDERIARVDGRARTESEWAEAVTRMLGYAGATTPFPVISAERDPARTAAWLAASLGDRRPAPAPADAGAVTWGEASVEELLLPVARDLAHDVAVDSAGRLIVTGMFTDRMYVLDTAARAFAEVPIPVQRANPRAVEVDAAGDWWIVLGAPGRIARYRPAAGAWDTWEVGMYAHSVALAPDGSAWFNGHFTRAPEVIGRVTPGGAVETVALPPHPTLAETPGGPIPYEIRVAADGRVWMSELQGNRLVAHDPATGRGETVEMPTAASGPRRFDVAPDGALWIPAYGANELVRYDPASRRWERWALPIRDAVPYVARVDRRTGAVWLGTAAADAALRFDPASGRFTAYRLPSRGALVRHLVVDPRDGAVWLAYGASPGIPARIARLRVRE